MFINTWSLGGLPSLHMRLLRSLADGAPGWALCSYKHPDSQLHKTSSHCKLHGDGFHHFLHNIYAETFALGGDFSPSLRSAPREPLAPRFGGD